MKKRILSLLLVFALCLSLAPMAVLAQEETTNLAKGAKLLGSLGEPPRPEEAAKYAIDGDRTGTKWCVVRDSAWMVFQTTEPVNPQGLMVYHAGYGASETNRSNTYEYALEVLDSEKITEADFLKLNKEQQASVMADGDNWTRVSYIEFNQEDMRYSDVHLDENRSVYRFNVIRGGSERVVRIYEVELLPNAIQADSINVRPRLEIPVNTSIYYNVYFEPSYVIDPYTCTIADESIARIEDRRVYGLQVGATTMTATSVTHPDLTVTVPVIVLDVDENYNPFKDVTQDDWFYWDVLWAYRAEIINGLSEHKFGPRQSCTRAQLVTILWKAEGQPVCEGTLPFTDVPEDAWYYDAVLWAVENGVTDGVSETLFAPNQICTRAEAMGFLWKTWGKVNANPEEEFEDVDESDWFYEAVNWAVAIHVATGISDTCFGPYNECQRAQIVSLVCRMKS